MAGSSDQDVTLIVKNPTRTEYDFKLTVNTGSTLLDLQKALQQTYDGKPDPACQTVITCNSFDHSSCCLRRAGGEAPWKRECT